MWRATVLTIFPDMFPGPLGASLAGRAAVRGLWSLAAVDIRDYATDKHRAVDDTPAGGGLEEVSVGDYVLSGGEIAAMALIDACVRLIPGVMGKEVSAAEESFSD